MPDFVNTFFEERVEQLFDLAGLAERLFSSAGLEYRIAGGLAAYLYVEEAEPDAGRLTKDIDIVVRRAGLEGGRSAAASFGVQHRHAGVDMLVRPDQPSGRRAIHLYPEPTLELGLNRRIKGLRLIPLADLIHMKLTSFRAKDEANLNDLDEAGLITPEVEAGLSPSLAERLARVRARGEHGPRRTRASPLDARQPAPPPARASAGADRPRRVPGLPSARQRAARRWLSQRELQAPP